ncbi:NAD(P)H-binding protein [Catenuloplanes indicus JCM 9534]
MLGPGGTVGRRVTARLRATGAEVRPVSRSTPVRFDWSAPETWAPALTGGSALFLMAPDGVPVDPELIALAARTGLRRIVLLSSRAIDVMGDGRLLDAERAVRDGGLEWSIVRADWFDQNFDEGFLRPAVEAGTVAIPVGGVRQTFADAGDIAAVAVAALTGDGHAGATHEVTGPEALTFGEACAIVGAAAGRQVHFDGTTEAYRAAMTSFGVPEPQIARDVAAFAALAAAGDSTPLDTVERLTGRPPRRFADYAAAAAW